MKKVLIIIICLCCLTACKKNEEVKNEITENNSSYTLELQGLDKIELAYGEKYEEPGFIAKDSDGNDITDQVIVNSDIKKTPGEYKVTYQITDTDITKTRIVTVNPVEVSENATYIPVLMYHYFYDDENGEVASDANHLAKSDFIAQLEYLKENNYYYPTMQELKDYLDGKIMLPKKSIILTMDDGNESNYRIAYPLALKYEIPIVWFVVTSWTDPNLPYQQEIINSGYVTMESHTHDMHKSGCSGMGHGGYFQCVDDETGLKDLQTSKEMLKTAISLAYPFGDYNDHTKDLLKKAGYSLAFTTEWGVVKRGMDPYQLPRIRISAGSSLQTFIDSI